MFNPLDISSFFLKKSFDEGEPITNMKILKLVYIAHGWHLGITGKPLVNEAVKAWKYGPVIESIYKKFKSYKGGEIDKIPLESSSDITSSESDINYDEFLNKIWDVYKEYDGLQLSTLTHMPGTPWDDTIKQNGVNSIIPNDLIEEYYKKRVTH